MLKNLASRKFLATLLGALASVFLPALGIPAEGVDMAVKLITIYVGTQGLIDLTGAAREKKP